MTEPPLKHPCRRRYNKKIRQIGRRGLFTVVVLSASSVVNRSASIRKTEFLAVLFPVMAGNGARIDPLEILKLVDIGECFQSRIELPELFNRHIAGADAADHRAKGIGLVILKVS